MKALAKGLACLACLISLSAQAAEGGTMLRDDDLRASASTSASSAAKVSKGAQVEILNRQGAWMQIRHEGKTGWVRLLNVRKGAASQTDVAGGLAGVLSLGTTRSDPGGVVATAGVRGLNEEELKGAKFNAQELQKLEGLGVSSDQAKRFASQGRLVARDVAYLPAPQAKGQSQGAGTGGGFDFMGGQ